MRHKTYFILLLVGCLLLTVALPVVQAQAPLPTAEAYDASFVTAWYDLQLELVRTTPGFTPPVASRAFGYTGVALYEAIVPGLPAYQSLAGQLNELDELPQPAAGVDYHWSIVANSALRRITQHMFFNTPVENQTAIEALYRELHAGLAAGVDPDIVSRSVTQGRVVADAVFIWSLTDGGYQGQLSNFPESYVPTVGTGMWEPTPRLSGDPLPALQPYWGDNRPFALTMGETCVLEAPPAYSEDIGSYFYLEALEVYTVVKNLTPEQEDIALFWADDPGTTSTPPGHSISILNQVLRIEDARLDLAAEAYAKLGIAVADAFIGCWHYKYQYNLLRPITYIRQVIDAEWNTPLVTDPVETPPFPEYPSGHSVQSGATAAVLTHLFGESYAFIDHTHTGRGLSTRQYGSFWDFADEAAISRLYGGIHYRAAIENGVEQGKCIGEQVNALQFHADV